MTKKVTRGLDAFVEAHGQQRLKRQQAEIGRLQETVNRLHKQRKGSILNLPCDTDTVTFGVCGDLHMGSLYEASDKLAIFFRACAEAGVRDILCAGDILDGWKMYRGQEFELAKIGYEQQSKHFADIAPQIKGVTVRFITGNHDASFKTLVGMNVGELLQGLRPDWQCIGEDSADVVFTSASGREYRVRLIHPSGGTSYAISYRGQKIVESLAGGSKPQMLGIGHYHKSESIPNYRNVHVLQTGCFQWQTPFMERGGLSAAVGGWLVRVGIGTEQSLCNTVETKFIGFY